MERLSNNESLAVVLKIGRMYITLGTLYALYITFGNHNIVRIRDERATDGTSIKFPKECRPLTGIC
jgi:hypothetical protein